MAADYRRDSEVSEPKICVVTYAEGIDGPDEIRLVSDREEHADAFFRGFAWRHGLESTERVRIEVWSKLDDGNFRRERCEGRGAWSEQGRARDKAREQRCKANGVRYEGPTGI